MQGVQVNIYTKPESISWKLMLNFLQLSHHMKFKHPLSRFDTHRLARLGTFMKPRWPPVAQSALSQ